jgi:hypothetical protein
VSLSHWRRYCTLFLVVIAVLATVFVVSPVSRAAASKPLPNPLNKRITVTTAAQAAHFGVPVGSIISGLIPTPHCYQTTPAIRQLALENKLTTAQMESYGFPAKWSPSRSFYDAVTHDITNICTSVKVYRNGWRGTPLTSQRRPSTVKPTKANVESAGAPGAKIPQPNTVNEYGCTWNGSNTCYAGYSMISGTTADPYESWLEAMGEWYWPSNTSTELPFDGDTWSTWMGLEGPSCYDTILQPIAASSWVGSVESFAFEIEDNAYNGDCSILYHNDEATGWTNQPVPGNRFIASAYEDGYATLEDYTKNENFPYTSEYAPDTLMATCTDEAPTYALSEPPNDVDETVFFNCNAIDENYATYYIGDSAHTTNKYYIDYPNSGDHDYVPSGITHASYYGTFYVSCENNTWPPATGCAEA